MNIKNIRYLDHNATTPLKKSAREAMLAVMDAPYNPSSIHSYGREAKKILNDATKKLLTSIGAENASIIFTSSGTESNNTALNALKDIEVFITSAIEHVSIAKPLESKKNVIKIAVDNEGMVKLEELKKTLKENSGKKILVSIIHSNNETGVIQNAKEIAKIVFENKGFLHFDCSQSLGKINFSFDDIGADMVTLSSHKLGGPKGVAALIIKKGLEFTPFISGGGQQKFLRAGTENLPAIAGFAEAVSESVSNLKKYDEHCKKLISYFESKLKEKYPDALIFSKNSERLPNTSNFAIRGKKSETELIKLDLKGFCLSSGSACSSGKVSTSHVLTAMGYEKEIAECAIRLSVGLENNIDEISELCNIM